MRMAGIRRHAAQAVARLAVPFALVVAAAPARADGSVEPVWPDGKVHPSIGAAFGWCSRQGLAAGGAGACGEAVTVGVDFPIRSHRTDMHFLIELGYGLMTPTTWGDPVLGVATGSGGEYGVVRPMFGFDVTRLFFVRFGAQFRALLTLETLTPGGEAVVELGTRIGDSLEIGIHGMVGADGVLTSPGGLSDAAFVLGTNLFFRFVIR
jgi:hypothetical protein